MKLRRSKTRQTQPVPAPTWRPCDGRARLRRGGPCGVFARCVSIGPTACGAGTAEYGLMRWSQNCEKRTSRWFKALPGGWCKVCTRGRVTVWLNGQPFAAMPYDKCSDLCQKSGYSYTTAVLENVERVLVTSGNSLITPNYPQHLQHYKPQAAVKTPVIICTRPFKYVLLSYKSVTRRKKEEGRRKKRGAENLGSKN